MTFTNNYIKVDGAKSISVTVPCFCGDDDFYEASRMNRFYEKATGVIYDYAVECIGIDAKRIRFFCDFETNDSKNTIDVLLRLSLNISGRKTLRRTVRHTWQNGRIISKSVQTH